MKRRKKRKLLPYDSRVAGAKANYINLIRKKYGLSLKPPSKKGFTILKGKKEGTIAYKKAVAKFKETNKLIASGKFEEKRRRQWKVNFLNRFGNLLDKKMLNKIKYGRLKNIDNLSVVLSTWWKRVSSRYRSDETNSEDIDDDLKEDLQSLLENYYS